MYDSMDTLRAGVRYEQQGRRAAARQDRLARTTRGRRGGWLTRRDAARLRADFANLVAEAAVETDTRPLAATAEHR
jgi:hypothetical protein